MAVSYDYYRIFYYVAKYGSFTQAAKILLSNQPNITRAMNNLEAELGCTLFYRSRNGVQLTPVGEKLFIHVESAIRQLQLGESEVASENTLHSGHLSVAISEIALHLCMLPVLQKYQSLYPGIHITILNTSTTQGIEAVQQGLADLAVVSSPTGQVKPLEITSLCSFQDVPIAGSRFKTLAEKSISLQDLTSLPLICLGKNTKTYEFYNALFAEHGLVLEPDIEAATTDQILPLVEHGIGIGFVPAQFTQPAVKRGDIFPIRLKETIPVRYICLIRDKSRPASIAASAFIHLIQAESEGS